MQKARSPTDASIRMLYVFRFNVQYIIQNRGFKKQIVYHRHIFGGFFNLEILFMLNPRFFKVLAKLYAYARPMYVL